jgi:hypothetical protein
MTCIARLVLPVLIALGCSDVTTELIDAANGWGDAAPGDSAVGPTGPCGGQPCECNNGRDEDADGLVDGLDPECTSPFDDDESSFATGRPGGALDFCQDCYWDENDVSDDDGCLYHTQCLFGETPTGSAASGCVGCEVSTQCFDTCRERTPNGCDCFGCCTVTGPSGTTLDVLLSDSCSLRDVENEMKCPRCQQSDACRNGCGECELCPGRKRRDLPQQCRGNPNVEEPESVCDEGQQVCAADAACPTDYYCQLGCCLYIVQ